MDNQLIASWIILLVLGIGLDVGIYLFLRADWRKNGVLRTDVFFDRIFDRLTQLRKTVKNGLALGLVRYYRDSVPGLTPAPGTVSASETGSVAVSEPEPVMDTDPVEIIPISVENVGQMRHIQFTLDMPIDSQVDVRIGATNEAGVTVQKREL